MVLIVVPELSRVEYANLLSFVSLEKRKRLKRFQLFSDAQNSLLGDVLARIELCRIAGLRNSELEFDVNSCGKPFLVNNSCVHYNVSHTSSCVACVIDDVPVGIDVELIRPIDVSMVERFFVHDEQTHILSVQGDIRDERFFEVWTKKESRIKWEGENLFGSLTSLNVLNSLEQPKVFYHCIYNNDKIVGYVCSSKKEPPSVKVINTSTLLRNVKLLLK